MKLSGLLHKRRGSILFELCISVIIMGILFAVIYPSTGTKIRSISDDISKDQTLVIDNALSIWCSSHDSKYPDNLSVLKEMDFISKAIDINQFTYSIKNNKTEYSLKTILKDGSTYQSPGSKY